MNSAICRKFSWEGFCKVDIALAVREAGYSATEVWRLLGSNAIKVMGTKVTDDGNHYVGYKRVAEKVELLEPNDVIMVGKHQTIQVKPIPFSIFERIYYNLRALWERAKDATE